MAGRGRASCAKHCGGKLLTGTFPVTWWRGAKPLSGAASALRPHSTPAILNPWTAGGMASQ